MAPLGSVLLFSSCSTCFQGMAAGPGQMKVTLPVSAGHGSVLIWLTFPAEPGPQAFPYSLLHCKPGPNNGLLCPVTCRRSLAPSSLKFCILPFLPSISDPTTLQATWSTVTDSQLMMWGFGKYYSTAAEQGSEGRGGTRSSPCPLQNGCWVGYGIYLKGELLQNCLEGGSILVLE